jgi:hypothetical protein
MSDLKHTPGPWFIEPKNPFLHDEGCNVFCIVPDKEIFGDINICEINIDNEDVESNEAQEQMWANAVLIKSVPDIYKVCKEAYEFILSNRADDGERMMVLACLGLALNKAEGRQ